MNNGFGRVLWSNRFVKSLADLSCISLCCLILSCLALSCLILACSCLSFFVLVSWFSGLLLVMRCFVSRLLSSFLGFALPYRVMSCRLGVASPYCVMSCVLLFGLAVVLSCLLSSVVLSVALSCLVALYFVLPRVSLAFLVSCLLLILPLPGRILAPEWVQNGFAGHLK